MARIIWVHPGGMDFQNGFTFPANMPGVVVCHGEKGRDRKPGADTIGAAFVNYSLFSGSEPGSNNKKQFSAVCEKILGLAENGTVAYVYAGGRETAPASLELIRRLRANRIETVMIACRGDACCIPEKEALVAELKIKWIECGCDDKAFCKRLLTTVWSELDQRPEYWDPSQGITMRPTRVEHIEGYIMIANAEDSPSAELTIKRTKAADKVHGEFYQLDWQVKRGCPCSRVTEFVLHRYALPRAVIADMFFLKEIVSGAKSLKDNRLIYHRVEMKLVLYEPALSIAITREIQDVMRVFIG